MPIPFDLEKTFKTAAAVSKRERLKAEKRRSAEVEADHAEARQEREERAAARPAARAIWRWVMSAEVQRVRELALDAGLSELQLLGPVWQDGSIAPGLRTGASIVSLCTTGKGLRLTHRGHPMGGYQRDLHSAAKVAEVLAPAIVRRLASEIERGLVWRRLRGLDVGAIRRRLADERHCPWSVCTQRAAP